MTLYRVLLIIFLSCDFLFSQNKIENYITNYKQLAIDEMNRYSIPASITLAQGILESGSGQSKLAKDAFNHFGIKCHKNWKGDKVYHDDDDENECFRKYNSVKESYRDHSLFLSERGRYSFLFNPKNDYKDWARGLKKAGYATNPKYAEKLINIIEEYNLNKFDKKILKDKSIYFSHVYGFPYLHGIGLYYFANNNIIFSEISTSYLFSNLRLGMHYNFYSNFLIGTNVGLIYYPQNFDHILYHVSIDLAYDKIIKNNKYKSLLIKSGIQMPNKSFFDNIDIDFVPYISLNYLVN